MKIYVLIILSFLCLKASSQQAKQDKKMMPFVTGKRLPFYTRIGNREIYHLYVVDTTVNYTGKATHAMAINGSIPAPVLNFTEGDTAEIYVHNQMMMETSIHWHGLILPNRYDGVSYLTTAPIMPGETHFYKFPLVQQGTYWYHSHTMTQQQSGMYGAFIIHPKERQPIAEYTLLLSDWIDENPQQVERSLHNATDWYSIRKGSTQSYWDAVKTGNLTTKIGNEWKRLMPMDVSDVYYERLFSNGKVSDTLKTITAGQKVRLHVVNGGSSTYFWLQFAGGKITVVANDGEEVQPVTVDRMIVAVAETYDVEVTLPANGSYEFSATAEDRSKATSLWIGEGTVHPALRLPGLKYFEGMKMMNGMISMNGDLQKMNGMSMSGQAMDMNTVMYPEITGDENTGKNKVKPKGGQMQMDGMDMDMSQMGTTDQAAGKPVTLNYTMLKSPRITTLPPGPVRLLHFNLTGNMNRYVWTINNKTVSESDKVLIRKGENVRIILYNNTMMRHPMHLHGHYFRLLNGQGAYSPLKNTLDIMPMETDTIEFRANASGDWFFHCHILYHMMAGMGRIFQYQDSPPNPEIPDTAAAIKKIYADDRHYYAAAKVGLESKGSAGMFALANTRWLLSTTWDIGLNSSRGYADETIAGRYIDRMQWLLVYGGFDYQYRKHAAEKNLFGQNSDQNDRHTAIAGFAYTLPMLMVADARIDAHGKIRLQLERNDIALTSRLRFSLMANTDKEYETGLRYIITKYFSLSGRYDSDLGLGGGVTLTY